MSAMLLAPLAQLHLMAHRASLDSLDPKESKDLPVLLDLLVQLEESQSYINPAKYPPIVDY